jgi:hypothetical protein
MKTNIVTIYVTPENMLRIWKYPYFGYTNIIETAGIVDEVEIHNRVAIIYIDKTLPAKVIKSVLAHETYHANDLEFKNSSVLWRELTASFAGFKASPLGFFHAVWLSLTSSARLRLYLSRIKNNF